MESTETKTTEREWLMKWARAAGFYGRTGGWVYNRAGYPVCHGWDAFLRNHVPAAVKSRVSEWV